MISQSKVLTIPHWAVEKAYSRLQYQYTQFKIPFQPNKENTLMQRITQFLTVALVAIFLGFAIPASASANPNDVCPGGVPTKQAFKSCYENNSAARALFDSLGINATGIKNATTTTVCANQGYTSYGRHYTPGSKKVTPDGQPFYKRPLSSVMQGCASAWLVKTKNGVIRVLKFCGNPQTKACKCKPPKKAKKKPKATFVKRLQGGKYTGSFTFKVTIGKGKPKTIKVKANQRKSLGRVRKCTKVKVTEINVPKGMKVKGNKTKIYKVCASRTLTYTNVMPSQPKPDQPTGAICVSTNSGNLSGVGAVQGSCNTVTVICQDESCNPKTENICPANASGGSAVNGSTGGNATAISCPSENPPPVKPPCTDCNPKPTPPSCTGLTVVPNSAKTGLTGTGLGVDATVSYNSGDDTFLGASINWGDGTSSNGTTASHTYTRSGTYTIVANLTFANAGGVTSVNCQKVVTVKLKCPPGSTPNTPEDQCVKDGATQPTVPGTPTTPPGPTTPSTGPSSQCKWEFAGIYMGRYHASGESVTPAEFAYAGNQCPPGSIED